MDTLNLPDIAALAPTVAIVDLDALRANLQWLRAQAHPARLMPVVKANAYGHGAVPVSRVLEASGVDRFLVATVPEAIELREAGIRGRILVMESPLPEYLPAFERYNLDVTISTREQATWVIERLQHGASLIGVHVKVDTGMGRLGMPPADIPVVIEQLARQLPSERLALWTHLATADEPGSPFTRLQVARFREVLAQVQDRVGWVHIANTGALFDRPEGLELTGRHLVRTGIALYGYPPSPAYQGQTPLHPVMQVQTRIIHIKTVPPGTSISYGRRWVATEPSVIATLAAGYADGYPRHASNRAEVSIRGRRYPVVGLVCMDMTMVSLGRPESVDPAIRTGDGAVLFGPEGPDAMELAAWADTIAYEICCRVSPRVPRIYRGA